MRDTAYTDEEPTALKSAFDRAGYHRVDPERTLLPVALDRPPEPENAYLAFQPSAGGQTTATAAVCDNLAVFGGGPDRDEFDTREIWDSSEAQYALCQATRRGRAMYERARTRIRLIAVDPEETLVFRGDDLIGRVWPVDPHAGGGVDLRIDGDPITYGLDDWEQVRPFVDAIVAGNPRFA